MRPQRPLVWPLVLGAALLGTGCARLVPDQYGRLGPILAFKLLSGVSRTTPAVTARETDLAMDNPELSDRVPYVLAKGQSPVVRLDGARARLYGDVQGTRPWSVESFLFVQVFTEDGRPSSTFVVGSPHGTVFFRGQPVDDLGKRSLTFEPGEIDLTTKVPDSDRFSVQATALASAAGGMVSEVYLVLEHRVRAVPEDELRSQ